MSKLTTKEITTTVKNNPTVIQWGLYSIYNDRLANNRRKLKFMRNGWRVPEVMKQAILEQLQESFKKAQNIESITWEVGSHYNGPYDFLKIVKQD